MYMMALWYNASNASKTEFFDEQLTLIKEAYFSEDTDAEMKILL